MRTVQVLGAAAALVLATGVGDALASSHPAKVAACVNSHGKIVSAKGKHCPKGSHADALPTVAAPATLPAAVPAGKTVTGTWVLAGPMPSGTHYLDTAVSFPVPFATAPIPVVIYNSITDPHCTGTVTSPTAAKGYVCIYTAVKNAVVTTLTPYSPVTDGIGGATRFGWGLYATTGSAGDALAGGTWAATAS